MECNRDEALRAKRLAEEKMLKNDFEGAQKIALKARQLFPELDNISQVITVCAVHCSAQKKIYGAEKDLYGILQVEKVADEATIRKQYRKLALVLHPDKNKFPGAEAAFKLIGEANMILSDKGKRSVYDFKCREPARASVTKLQNRQGNQSSYARTQNKFNDVPSSQFNNGHGKQSTSHTGIRPSFWTYCPFCNIKYEYYIDFVNRPLRCQHCSKLFIAYDIGAQGAAAGPRVHTEMHSANLGSNRAEPPVFQQKDVGRREKVKVNIQKDGQFPSHFAQQTKTKDTEVGDSSRTRETGKEGMTKPNVNVKPTATGNSKDTDRKRGRKMVAESSESGSDVEDAFGGIGVGPVGGSVHRRSSRQRQKVSYREDAADELSPQKRSRPESSSGDVKEMQEEVSGSGDKVFNTADVSKEKEHKVKEEEEAKTVDNDTKSVSDSSDKSDPELVDCLDPEFSNFDKDKEEHCFAVDQIWACYDSVDSMPRFYAQVRKVYKTEFRLRITWLEATPDEDLEIKWAEEGLPVACGKFVRGETEETKDRLMFSHQIAYKKGGGRFSYLIYPQKGEIWALFKDWDIKWSLDPESHRKYKFDIVEILSVNDNSVSVAFLLKVKGFVSLFQRTIWEGLAEHTIPFTELFRFSHRIPSVKLTGTERAGVPAGSFELDTASLPGDFETYYYSNEVNSCSPSREEKAKPATGLTNTPKKHVNSEATKKKHVNSEATKKKHVNSEATNGLVDKEMLNLRRSPRGGSKGGDMNHKQVNANDTNGDIDTTSKFTKSPGISSPSSTCRKSEPIHDFSADKQIWKFQVGQIWAFWDRSDGIRQCYAQIKLIESRLPRLHVSLVKLCNIPSNYAAIRYNACGLFKVSTGKTKVLDPDSFSHIVKAEASGNHIFNIYPREHQIWAMYKRQEGGELDIVEVLETDASSIKVLSLSRVPGYKSVFKAPRIQRSTGRIVVIPRLELNRFSHQIPAFHFTEEKDGSLRGCWELDHAALSGVVGPNQERN